MGKLEYINTSFDFHQSASTITNSSSFAGGIFLLMYVIFNLFAFFLFLFTASVGKKRMSEFVGGAGPSMKDIIR